MSNDSCWIIIKQKSGFDSRDDKQEVEQIGKDIAVKCGGVPLAAKSLGHMLKQLTSDQWESVRKSTTWNISASSEDTDSVLSSLRLTYSYMPSRLKLCFAYCAIFPKGHKMVKDDLIHQWNSLGFIEATDIFSTEQLGEKYISHLLGLSFLEYSRLHNSVSYTYLKSEHISIMFFQFFVHNMQIYSYPGHMIIKQNICIYSVVIEFQLFFYCVNVFLKVQLNNTISLYC